MRIICTLCLLLFAAPGHTATVSGLLCSTRDSLRAVGFDGTGFTTGATTLSMLLPEWTAMSLLFAPDPPPPAAGVIPLPATAPLLAAALGLIALRRRGS